MYTQTYHGDQYPRCSRCGERHQMVSCTVLHFNGEDCHYACDYGARPPKMNDALMEKAELAKLLLVQLGDELDFGPDPD